MGAEINLEERYALLRAKLGDAGLTAEEQLSVAGEFIDIALDLKRAADLKQAIEFMRNINRSALPPGGNAFLDYCIGDAFANLGILEHYVEKVPLQWGSDSWEQRLKHLRCAVRNEEDFAALTPRQQCCILNNLGTSLNATGGSSTLSKSGIVYCCSMIHSTLRASIAPWLGFVTVTLSTTKRTACFSGSGRIKI